MNHKTIIGFSFIILFSSGCSQGPTDITDKKWGCRIQNNTRNCKIEFTAINKSHLPTKSIIRIRAHNRESVMGSDAIQNIVVGDKVLNVVLNPGEKRIFNENIRPNGRVFNIVVTISSEEQ